MTTIKFSEFTNNQPVSVLGNEADKMSVSNFFQPTEQPLQKPTLVSSALKGQVSFPASVAGGATDVPTNIAKTFGNIPSSAVKLAAPVNPFNTESPVNIGANIAKSGSALKDIYSTQSPIEGTKSILKGFADTYLKIGESIYGGLDKAYNALLDDPKKAVADVTEHIAKIGIEDPMFIPTLLYGSGKLTGGKDMISRVVNPVTRGADTSLSNIASKTVQPVVNAVKNKVTKISNTIEDFGRKINAPEVSDATKVSLNPAKALAGGGEDIQVSVGGKLKKLSEVTPEEYEKMQLSTEKSTDKFTKEAELFKNNRNPLNDPTEIVGQRVDKALNFANKKRQAIGKKMGDIEAKYTNENLPIGEKTNSTFAETIKSFESKYGMDGADAKTVQKLVDDFDVLEKGGATIGERLEFVRSWDKYLNDAKDAFGKFKENATANTRIQNAVKTLKDETVDAISAKDKVYRSLRSQYSTYKKLDEIGDMLLGKDGMLGDRIKGGATVKRALKSNSDAGARQFLIKLKELTGYDAIKEGDIALTAMENVGDYQGLSLLEVLREGKGGIIKRGLEYARDKAVGNNAERTLRYIKDK